MSSNIKWKLWSDLALCQLSTDKADEEKRGAGGGVEGGHRIKGSVVAREAYRV